MDKFSSQNKKKDDEALFQIDNDKWVNTIPKKKKIIQKKIFINDKHYLFLVYFLFLLLKTKQEIWKKKLII